ncbi:hypothetical protein POTOM_017259 [Populus tomentosa]|uniref:Uncharacterized protein n=1 Tax=Populus tomentosa TaxID=118781 RepID=A0A8X8A402_POPTO|nr:hypothetical protein POTOM_017259 [Populus tomentosa]
MIKRRFFKAEHGEKDEASSDSSSSSSSESEAGATEQSEDDGVADPEENSESEDDDTVAEPKEESDSEASSSSSGYESEDSSANVIDGYSSDDRKTRTGIEILKKQSNATADEESLPDDIPDCILKCKSVYKCRICPRIICLTEETMRAHLSSKRHARSEKLMKENRLKVMLNSDGEIENLDEETHAERHARTVALAQKEGNAASMEKTTSKTKSPPKKRRKNEK